MAFSQIREKNNGKKIGMQEKKGVASGHFALPEEKKRRERLMLGRTEYRRQGEMHRDICTLRKKKRMKRGLLRRLDNRYGRNRCTGVSYIVTLIITINVIAITRLAMLP